MRNVSGDLVSAKHQPEAVSGLTTKFVSRWERLVGKLAKKQEANFQKAELQKFKRFAKAARKVGLLVSKASYIRYFRDPAETTRDSRKAHLFHSS